MTAQDILDTELGRATIRSWRVEPQDSSTVINLHSDFKILNVPATSAETLVRARRHPLAAGQAIAAKETTAVAAQGVRVVRPPIQGK